MKIAFISFAFLMTSYFTFLMTKNKKQKYLLLSLLKTYPWCALEPCFVTFNNVYYLQCQKLMLIKQFVNFTISTNSANSRWINKRWSSMKMKPEFDLNFIIFMFAFSAFLKLYIIYRDSIKTLIYMFMLHFKVDILFYYIFNVSKSICLRLVILKESWSNISMANDAKTIDFKQIVM